MLRSTLWCFMTAIGLTAALAAHAEVVSEAVDYEFDGKRFTGEIFYDDSRAAPQPGVLVVHEWWGLNEYAKRRARMLAELGYVAFAADMYGTGLVTTHPDEARGFMTAVTMNTEAWQRRVARALAILEERPRVDGERLAAIGYCFGGSSVLQLAYAGADVAAVVSFHGGLPVPTPEEARAIEARILVEHGAADSFVPEDQVTAFRRALDTAEADYTMHVHPGAQHGFTVTEADSDELEGTAYNAAADRASWGAMLDLFDDVFAAPE